MYAKALRRPFPPIDEARAIIRKQVPSAKGEIWRRFVNEEAYRSVGYDLICKMAVALGISPKAEIAKFGLVAPEDPK